MRHRILAAGCAIGLSALVFAAGRGANGGPKAQTVTIRLHHIQPSDFLSRFVQASGAPSGPLATRTIRKPVEVTKGVFVFAPEETKSMMPADIEQIDTDDTTGKLTVRAGAESIGRLRDYASLMDVEPASVKFDVHVVRERQVPDSIGGSATPLATHTVREIVASGSARADNDQPVDVAMIGAGRMFAAHLQMHVRGDGKVAVQASLNEKPLRIVESEIGKWHRSQTHISSTEILGTDGGKSGQPTFVSRAPDGHTTVRVRTLSADGDYYLDILPHILHSDLKP